MDDKLRVVTEGLSEEQKNAVLSLEGPVLIVAGAGSGKTRVLTSRVAALLARGDDPSTVLALTFTKKAAGEMKERIAAMVGAYKAARVVMGTFHSVFIRFLRDYSEVISYPRDFTIYDTTDSVNLVKDCIKTLGLDDKTYKPREVFSRISGAKNALVMPAEYAQRSDIQEADFRTKRPRIAEIYRLYSERCKTYGVMDFDDILLNMNILLRDSPEALEEISSRFNHILVDEYQDTNFAQYVIIRKLAAKHRNICVVGDDSQSIYAFRGAKIENILNFKKDYPECRLFRLERNYRSTRNIVNAANELISHNEGRIPKQCYSEGESGEKIKLLNADSDRSEAMMVTSSILSRLRDEKAQYQDFAILYRTNSQSRAFEEALRRRNVPYRIYSGNAFFDRQEVRELMAYFKLAVNPSDDEAFKRAVMKPRRGVAEQGLAVLSEAAAAASVSILEAIPHLPENVRPATRNSLNSFYRMMHSFIDECATADAYKLCRRIASESGLLALYKEDVSVQGQSRAANIEELMDSVAAFVEEQTSDAEGPALVTLADYLENVSLLSNIDLSEDEGEDVTNMVNLMTVHSAK
ncbi:MAG: UvrD-helicase domain-containing protein, partial [Bacteroidales bacterium]|nr:UvrD-helicase domain-containing protein [Bacteroidales bacterium]